MAGALDGITILDFTQFQQGTFSTVLLADLGANVLKVEQPGGDRGRRLGLHVNGYSSYFESLNRNKRSIVIDLRKPEGKEIVYRLAKTADVAVENYRRGALDRLGVGYEALRRHNPRIIYASASMWGPRGERAEHPGYDNIAQAAGGMMMATRHNEEVPYSPQPGLADQVGGMMLSHGILAALLARERTGAGQRIDASLYGSQIALQGIHVARALCDVPLVPPGAGSTAFSHRSFCADAVWIAFGYLTADFWPGMCRALDLEWLTTDPRFADPVARGKHQHALVECVDAQVAMRPSNEWIERLVRADVPCGVVQDFRMIGEDPQALENDYILSYTNPKYGPVRAHGFSVAMSETPASVRYAAPSSPGLQSEEILCELGYTGTEIEALISSLVVHQTPAGTSSESRIPSSGNQEELSAVLRTQNSELGTRKGGPFVNDRK
ncbi:MAG: CaiB/BaiF CoA transferase family protein [Dehalococcoidia bacterium]